MVDSSFEQRINIKFLVKLGKTGLEIKNLLTQVYGDNTLSKSTIYKWVKRFSEGREDVTDDDREGRPTTSRTKENIEKIRGIVRSNKRFSIRCIADEVHISRETVRKVLNQDLLMKKVPVENCAKNPSKSAPVKLIGHDLCVYQMNSIK